MIGRVIPDGAVLVRDGRIEAVGPFVEVRRDACGVAVEDLGEAVLLPGLVNAHVHLELSDCTPGERPTDGLEGWLRRMLERARLDARDLQERSAKATRAGIAQCLAFGVTTVGDISRQCQVSRPILASSRLRAVSFGEVAGMGQRRGMLEPLLEVATDVSCVSERMRVGVSPHAPYSVEPAGYLRCLERARESGLPLATHLAETRSEWEFLESHGGKLRSLWDGWLGWDEAVPRYPGGPIRMAADLGLLEYPSVLAHVNYCDDAELELLSAGSASVVYCPRTHAWFGHPPHRFGEMAARGINVALGTDSCASSPDLNLLDDLRLVHKLHPRIAADQLWAMATVNGARALGLDSHVGTLEPGKHADMFAITAGGSDPLKNVLESDALPFRVWIGAEILAGRRPGAD